MKQSATRQQAAIDMLVSYSWAILLIAIAVAIIVVLALSRPITSYEQSTCSIQPLFPVPLLVSN